MLRKIAPCWLLIAAALLGSGAIAAPQGKRVALLTPSTANPYIGTLNPTFMKNVEAKGVKVNNVTSPFDAALQSQQVDDAIAQKFDLIVIGIINHQAITPALTRAKAAKVPVILVTNPPSQADSDLYVSYIGYDQEELGRMAGENIVKALTALGKSKAQVAVVTGTATQLGPILRMVGFKAVLAKHPGIKLVDEGDGKWNTALSEKIAGDFLVRFAGRGGLDGFYGMADNQTAAIIQAIESAGLKAGVANKGVVVVGSVCMKEGINNIRQGKQYSTNSQQPVEEGTVLAQRVIDYFSGKTLKKFERVEPYAITTENVDKFAQGCTY